MPEINFEGVWMRYSELTIISDLNLRIADGEFMIFVGPSGCGKTTTLRMLAGLDIPTHGKIIIGGDDVTLKPPGERDIAMVFQSYALYPHLTVRKNLSFGPEIRKESKADIRRRVEGIAELVGLQKLLDRRPAELSGGQRQRVALARAMIRRPRTFLLDEPLSNLDAGLRTHMRTEISELQRKLGVTTVYVTHDQVEAMTMGHRIAVFDHGRILQVATPSELYRAPASKAVGTFIGSPKMNLIPATLEVTDGAARVSCLSIVLRKKNFRFAARGLPSQLELGLRPDDIHWTKDAPSRCTEAVTGTVTSVETTGSETFVLVDVAGVEINSKFPSFAPIKLGDPVDLVFDADDLHFFDANSGLNVGAPQ